MDDATNEINIHITEKNGNAAIAGVTVAGKERTEFTLPLSELTSDDAINNASNRLREAINGKPEIDFIPPPTDGANQSATDEAAKQKTLSKNIILTNKSNKEIFNGSLAVFMEQLSSSIANKSNANKEKLLEYIKNNLNNWEKSGKDISDMINASPLKGFLTFTNNLVSGGAYNTRKNLRRREVSSTRKGYYANKLRRTYRMNSTNRRVTRRRSHN